MLFCNGKWHISSISGVYRIPPYPIYTMYISRDFNSCFLLVAHLLVIGRLSVGRMHYPYNKQSTKSTATRNGWRWGLIEKKNKIALIVFNYSVTRVKL